MKRSEQIQEEISTSTDAILRTVARLETTLEDESRARQRWHTDKERRAFWMGFAIIAVIPFLAVVIANTSKFSATQDIPAWIVGFLGAAALIAVVGYMRHAVLTYESHDAWQRVRSDIVSMASRMNADYRWITKGKEELEIIQETLVEARATLLSEEADAVSDEAVAQGKSGFITPSRTGGGFVPLAEAEGYVPTDKGSRF